MIFPKKILLFLFAFGCSVANAQHKLESSKTEIKSGSGRSSSSSSSKDSSCDDDELGVVAQAIFDITFAVFKYGLIGDYTHETHLCNDLTAYPFANTISGNYLRNDHDGPTRPFRFDLAGKFVYNDNNLTGMHWKAKMRPLKYFSLQTDYHQLFEHNRLEGTHNQLALFFFNVAYDRIKFEKFNLGWTLGAAYVASDVQKSGISYGLSAEYFLSNNLGFSAAAKWSQVNGQPVNDFELDARYHRSRWFFSLGYERLKIATPNYNFVTLGTGIYF